MKLDIVTIAQRPELAATTGLWRWDAFFRHRGEALADRLHAERQAAEAAALLPTTLVLLSDNVPIGMASLVAQDLAERPDLTPWLAGVYVAPHARRRGCAGRRVEAVESLAADASIPTLWLYTRTAERIYARAGWRIVERFDRNGAAYALMRHDLAEDAKPTC